ncbi:hypothetical protein DPMN_021401 [Dreissena polymorpha]|uniref:Uncharacterized protein n=1 Tax=Dreissena polymorpha TaxID=45954 RepID=A0A9D4NKP6_DREPO|nr:hypothetical protein DPMN_021401 [Dreissena polymorpha]
MQELPPEKKKLPPPLKIQPSYKPSPATWKSKVKEAPVTIHEVQQLYDLLDFLAKYCIINPDRLPYCEPRARWDMVKLPPPPAFLPRVGHADGHGCDQSCTDTYT